MVKCIKACNLEAVTITRPEGARGQKRYQSTARSKSIEDMTPKEA